MPSIVYIITENWANGKLYNYCECLWPTFCPLWYDEIIRQKFEFRLQFQYNGMATDFFCWSTLCRASLSLTWTDTDMKWTQLTSDTTSERKRMAIIVTVFNVYLQTRGEIKPENNWINFDVILFKFHIQFPQSIDNQVGVATTNMCVLLCTLCLCHIISLPNSGSCRAQSTTNSNENVHKILMFRT